MGTFLQPHFLIPIFVFSADYSFDSAPSLRNKVA